MDGVIILEETLCRNIELQQLIASVAGFFIMFVCTLSPVFEDWRWLERVGKFLAVCFMLVMTIILSLLPIWAFQNYYTFHTEYTITIDAPVNFDEFYNRYEVIDVDGNTYTVIERERDVE